LEAVLKFCGKEILIIQIGSLSLIISKSVAIVCCIAKKFASSNIVKYKNIPTTNIMYTLPSIPIIMNRRL